MNHQSFSQLSSIRRGNLTSEGPDDELVFNFFDPELLNACSFADRKNGRYHQGGGFHQADDAEPCRTDEATTGENTVPLGVTELFPQNTTEGNINSAFKITRVLPTEEVGTSSPSGHRKGRYGKKNRVTAPNTYRRPAFATEIVEDRNDVNWCGTFEDAEMERDRKTRKCRVWFSRRTSIHGEQQQQQPSQQPRRQEQPQAREQHDIFATESTVEVLPIDEGYGKNDTTTESRKSIAPTMDRMFCRKSKDGSSPQAFGGGSNNSLIVHGQVRAVYRKFGPDPKELIQVEQKKVKHRQGLSVSNAHSNSIPKPDSPDHVVIRIEAATVTIQDCLYRRGFCFDIVNPVSLPVTPGQDAVGVIVNRGDMVENFQNGDRVAVIAKTGCNARYMSAPISSLIAVPKALDASEAVCMVTSYATAYRCIKFAMLQGSKNAQNPTFVLPGKKILVYGGMDGVAHALIQLCNKARAEVYAATPERRYGYMTNILGAKPVPMDPVDWPPEIIGQMDMVFDGICKDGCIRSHRALNPSGRLICYGQSSMLEQEMGVFGAPTSAHIDKFRCSLLPRSMVYDAWESFQNDPIDYKRTVETLFELLRRNKIKPHIAKRVSLADVGLAHGKLESGQVRGIVVCLPWSRLDRKCVRLLEEDDDAE